MPSRVRIRLTTDGRRIYDTKAVISLQQMYARSLAKGFSTAIPVLPEVKWRKAVVLFQNIKQYVHHYDPGMRLLVVRERRGERSKTPVQKFQKKLKQQPHAHRLAYNPPPRQRAIPPLRNDWTFINPVNPIQDALQGRVVINGAVGLDWNFNNDPNR